MFWDPDVVASLRELSEPWSPGDRVKAAIDRAAKAAGLTYWRTFDLWYGKARRIEATERDAIAEAVNKKRKAANRNDLHNLRLELERLEARLAQSDPDFHRPTIDRLRAQSGALRPQARGPRRVD